MSKEKATIEMVIRWLDSNIDEAHPSLASLAADSKDLKEKIELALDPSTTVEDIEGGNF